MSAPDQDQRTIDPTPHRIQEFRKRGEIARSKELTGTATMFAGGLFLAGFGTSSIEAIRTLFVGAFSHLDRVEPAGLTLPAATAFALACVPAIGGGLAALALTTAIQLGAPPALNTPSFDLSKPFTLGGLSDLVSPKAAGWRALKSVLKVLFVGLAGWFAVLIEGDRFLVDPVALPGAVLARGQQASLRVLVYAGGALMVLAVADYIVARRRMAEKMKMTPEEFKRDMKQQEGDPEVKKARRRRMQELARRRIAVEVPNSDVVIVNPTHFAVALRYDAKKGGAPRVVAKGTDALAARIRELARKSGVPIVARPPLARLLYKSVKEGKQIPVELFEAVAEVLRYVYRLKGRAA
ncbi:MAG: EscU/YscU/HrcU family type III secretion system export apparatus switch protein [Deltaproteobacteria bacterium]|nr:EscU/YscU/HrcU family type III secretion system export apparatus switch protein [Deltaproteobacteria bacterium]